MSHEEQRSVASDLGYDGARGDSLGSGVAAKGTGRAMDNQYDYQDEAKADGRWKLYAILGGVLTLVVLGLIGWGLYSLGDSDQSALERLRDIAVIFIILLSFIIVILLAAITVALAFLIIQIKDRVIPLLEETTDTVKRLRGTADFLTSEAVKPVITVAGKYAKMRATMRTVTGRDGKRK